MSMVGFVVSGISLMFLVASVRAQADLLVYTAFFALGVGWGGLIPLQEVVWASFYGRRYLGAVRSAGMPFSLLLSASGPLLAAAYFDRVGNYDGAFLAVAAAALAGAVLLGLASKPSRPEAGSEREAPAAGG